MAKKNRKHQKNNDNYQITFTPGRIVTAPLRALRYIFGPRVGTIAALGIVSTLALSTQSVSVMAGFNKNTNDLIGNVAEDVFAGGMKKSFGETAGDTARRAVQAINAETDPERCNTDKAFLAKRPIQECREDQLRKRLTTYGAGALVMLAGSHLGQEDATKDLPKRSSRRSKLIP